MASQPSEADGLSEDQKKHLLETMAQVIGDLPPNIITASLDTTNPFQSKGVVDVNSTDLIFTEMIKQRIDMIHKQQPPPADQAQVLKELDDLKAHHGYAASVFKDTISKLQDVMKEATGVQIPSAKFLEELYKFKQLHPRKPVAAANPEPKKDEHVTNQPPSQKPQPASEDKPKQAEVAENKEKPKQSENNADKSKQQTAAADKKPSSQATNENHKPEEQKKEPTQVKQEPPKQADSQPQPQVQSASNNNGQGKDQTAKTDANGKNQQLPAPKQEQQPPKNLDPPAQNKKQKVDFDTQKAAEKTVEEKVDPKTLPQPNTTKKATVGDIQTGENEEHSVVYPSPKQQQSTNPKLDEVKNMLDNLNLKDEAALKKQLNDLKGKLALMDQQPHSDSFHQPPQVHNEEDQHYYNNEDEHQNDQSFEEPHNNPYQDELKLPSPKVKKPKVIDIAKLKEKGMAEIYNFYCKQHLMGIQKMTFEAIVQEGQKMLFGDFLKMCQDFQINIKKDQLLEIYRMKVRRHGGQQHLTYQPFLELLSEVFQHLHLEQYDAREQELHDLKSQLEQLMRDNPDIIDNQIEAQQEHEKKEMLEQSIQDLELAQEISVKCGSSKKKSWRGHLTLHDEVHEILFDHLDFNKNKIEGSGNDEIGEFTVTGTFQLSTGAVEFLKLYNGDKQNVTQFTGKYDSANATMEGTCKLKGTQDQSSFLLERDAEHQTQTKDIQVYFLEKAHNLLQTTNKNYYTSKMKGFHRAFGGMNEFSDPKLMEKLKRHAPHMNYGGKNVIPEMIKSNKSAILEKSISHRKNESNVSSKLANVQTTGKNLYQDDPELMQQHLKLRQLSVKSQQQKLQQQTPDSQSNQQYHIKERLNGQLKKQEKQNREWIKEQALARIRNGQARIGGGMRDYSSEEQHHPVPKSSQGHHQQYPSSIEQQTNHDNDNISIQPSSPRGGSSIKVRGQQSMRASVQKPSKNLTLEQLRNIPNPKDLFTKRDREQFALLLGLSEDDLPSSPQNGNKSPKNANNGQKQQANNMGRNKNISVTQKSMDGASQIKNNRHPSVNRQQAPQQQHPSINNNRGEYLDQRSMEYHQKIMNRANEIDHQLKSKRQKEAANNSQLHPHLVKDNSKDLLTQKKGQHQRGQSDIGHYQQHLQLPQSNRKLNLQSPQQQQGVRHSSVVRQSNNKNEKQNNNSPRQLQKVDSHKRVSPQNVRQSGNSSPKHQQQQQQQHQSPNKKQAIMPGGKNGQVGGPAQNIMIQQQQEQLRQMQQQLSVLKNQQKRFY